MSVRSFKDYLKQKDQIRSQSTSGTQSMADSSTSSISSNSNNSNSQSSNTRSNNTSWSDIDTLVKNYQNSNALPPLLTPEIPKVYTETTTSPQKEQNFSIPQLLSPTLPKKYERIETSNENDRIRNKRHLSNTPDHGDKETLDKPTSTEGKKDILESDKKHNEINDSDVSTSGHSTSRHHDDSVPEKKRRLMSNSPRNTERIPETKPGASHSSDPTRSKQSQTTPKQTKAKTLDDFVKLKDYYVKLAIEKKHKGDKLLDENMTLGVVNFIDCILLYLVGFSYEDESRRVGRKVYNDVPWLSLVAFADSVIELTKDEKQYHDLFGFCLQVRVVVYEHITKIVTEFIQMDQSKSRRSQKLEDKLNISERITKHINNLFKYREASRKSLLASEKNISIFQLQKKYPSIVEDFELRRESPYKPKKLIDPPNDKINLPINSATTINELTAYGYKLIGLWCQKNKVKYTKWNI